MQSYETTTIYFTEKMINTNYWGLRLSTPYINTLTSKILKLAERYKLLTGFQYYYLIFDDSIYFHGPNIDDIEAVKLFTAILLDTPIWQYNLVIYSQK